MGSKRLRISMQILTPVLLVGAACVLTKVIPILHQHNSLFLFLAAIILSIRISGWLSGLLATLLAVGTISYFMFEPFRSFSIRSPDDVFKLTTFVIVSLLILSLQASRGKHEQALRVSEQRLKLALDSAHLGVWDYNLLTRKFWWSSTLEVIYGRTSGNFPTSYGRFFGFIHFDDQPIFNRAITRTIDEGTDYEVDHRIILPDDSIRWVNTRGRVFFNENSRAERIVGITTDITAKKKIERQQELSRAAVEETRLSTVA
jgi:PAS domain-containing protein